LQTASIEPPIDYSYSQQVDSPSIVKKYELIGRAEAIELGLAMEQDGLGSELRHYGICTGLDIERCSKKAKKDSGKRLGAATPGIEGSIARNERDVLEISERVEELECKCKELEWLISDQSRDLTQKNQGLNSEYSLALADLEESQISKDKKLVELDSTCAELQKATTNLKMLINISEARQSDYKELQEDISLKNSRYLQGEQGVLGNYSKIDQKLLAQFEELVQEGQKLAIKKSALVQSTGDCMGMTLTNILSNSD
jgi:chromosome segregation ATPase